MAQPAEKFTPEAAPPQATSHALCPETERCDRTRAAAADWTPPDYCTPERLEACPLADQHTTIRDYISMNKPAIGRMLHGVFEISTFDEAEKLATMLASHCPNPDMAAIGIWELLANAIEHGNLEIDFALKSTLLLQGRLHGEINRRQKLPQYRSRTVRVFFKRQRRSIRLRIIDEGPGFDFEAALKAERPALAPNGRGLMLARTMTFSRIRFIGAGNIVDATIDLAAPPLPTPAAP